MRCHRWEADDPAALLSDAECQLHVLTLDGALVPAAVAKEERTRPDPAVAAVHLDLDRCQPAKPRATNAERGAQDESDPARPGTVAGSDLRAAHGRDVCAREPAHPITQVAGREHRVCVHPRDEISLRYA